MSRRWKAPPYNRLTGIWPVNVDRYSLKPGIVYIIRNENNLGIKVGYTTLTIEERLQRYRESTYYTIPVKPTLLYQERSNNPRLREKELQEYFRLRGCSVSRTGWIYGKQRETILRELIGTT